MRLLIPSLILASLAAAAPPPRTTGWIRAADGLKLYYERIGNGPQVVVLPLGFWLQPEFERLAAPSRSVIFYDQRNRGRSDAAPQATLAEEVRDLESLRRQLGIPKFSLIGYSYLGLMTVLYALEHPDRVDGIVQLGPVSLKFGATYPPDEQDADFQLEKAVPAPLVAEYRKATETGMAERQPREFCELSWRVMRYRLIGDPANVDRLNDSKCQYENEQPARQMKFWMEVRMAEMEQLVVPRDRVAKLGQRVLTIHGTRDRNAPYGAGKEWVRLLPNARLVTVQGAAHQSWAEAPDLVFGSIETFLSGKWPPRAERPAPR